MSSKSDKQTGCEFFAVVGAFNDGEHLQKNVEETVSRILPFII
jgi:hypothetical protein